MWRWWWWWRETNTNHDRHKIKIEHDIIDKPVKLDILNEIPPQVNEIPAHFIHEIRAEKS